MTPLQISLLTLYAFGMAAGQVMFKIASGSVARGSEQSTLSWLASLMLNGWFIAAILTYMSLSIAWVWILSFTPLSRAYPFVALAIIATPVLGHLLFAEPLTPGFLIGTTLIVAGLLMIVR
jgi:drug/metabolite transporter (DMT)-like permease